MIDILVICGICIFIWLIWLIYDICTKPLKIKNFKPDKPISESQLHKSDPISPKKLAPYVVTSDMFDT